MQRKRIAIAAVAVVATGAAVAFTLPSMAGTNASRGERAAQPATADGVAPELLTAMRRDLGVDADEARTRLKRAQWAGQVSSTLAAETGGAFAGSWLAKDGTTLKVAVTTSAAAEKVEAAGGEAVRVKRSVQQLDTAKEKLDQARSDAGDLTGWYVDAATNKVVVVAQPGESGDAWAFARSAGLDLKAVSVKTAERPKPLIDIRGGDAYIIGGNARCSIGFSVEGGFVTAGHCGGVGTRTSTPDGVAQGTTEGSVFPGSADMGFVRTNANFTPRPVVNDFNNNELPVAGNTEAPVGAAICRSGSTTGTFCGVIQAKNQTVNYPEGAVTGLTQTNVCAEGGDSGGSWLSGDQAQGVTSGGSGDCTRGGTTFFQPLNEILAEFDLTLVTTGAAQPPATEPPAEEPPATEPPAEEPPAEEAPAACPNQPIKRAGSLPRAGTGQIQPDGASFQVNAGRQTACLDVPAGADYDLLLQQRRLGVFRTVARGTGDGDLQLTHNGRGGIYRYVVIARSGSGAYNLSFGVTQ